MKENKKRKSIRDGAILAKRLYKYRRKSIVVTLRHPKRVARDEWACVVSLKIGERTEKQTIFAIDAFQALQLSFYFIHQKLLPYRKGLSSRITFPGDPGFDKSIPSYWDMRFG